MVCGSACQLIKIKSRVLFDKEIAQAAKIWSIITKEGCRMRGSDAVRHLRHLYSAVKSSFCNNRG